MSYDVNYYIHVDNKEGALKLITDMPYAGHAPMMKAVDKYAGPVVEQKECTKSAKRSIGSLQSSSPAYGITLDMVKVVVKPTDEQMRKIISLKALGLTEEKAVLFTGSLGNALPRRLA